MRIRHRSVARCLLLLLVLTAVSILPFQSAPASCAAPNLELEEGGSAFAGGSVAIQGRGFVDGCNDTGGSSTFGCDEHEEVVTPLTDVVLTLRQGANSWDLGSADAGKADDNLLGQVMWEVKIPDDVAPGAATLETPHSKPLVVAIAARR